MNTCKTCLHWQKFTDEFAIKFHGSYAGDCTSKLFVYEDGITPSNGLAYWDYEGYKAYFATGENFGCIHWEPKQ